MFVVSKKALHVFPDATINADVEQRALWGDRPWDKP